jgi:hypothetical protein
VNTSSGKHLKLRSQLRRLEALCDGRVKLVELSSDNALLEQVNGLPRNPGLQVGVLGGDGSLMRVMSCLNQVLGPEQLPLLVPVPFGTMCTTSRRWGAGTSPWQTLDAWIYRQAMILHRRETLSISADDEELVGCTVGTGLVTHFFERYEAMGARGFLTATRIAFESFLGSFVSSPMSRRIMQLMQCRLVADDEPISTSGFSLIVSSVFKDVGLGIQVTHQAGDLPGHVALVASGLPAHRLGPQFWRVLTGRPLKDSSGVDRLVERWSLTFPEQGCVIIDGDRRRAHSFRVRPGPVWSVLTRAPHE